MGVFECAVTVSESVCVCVSLTATVQWYIPCFSLCDSMQLALIKSHLGAFDSKVPVSPLSNLSVAQAGCRRNLRQSTPAVISILFLSEITSHKNTELKAPQSKQTTTLLWLNTSVADLFFLLLNSWYCVLICRIDPPTKVQNNNSVQTSSLPQLEVSHLGLWLPH